MRVKNSFLNMVTSLVFMVIIGILGFVKINYFITYLGSDANGLIQMVYRVLGYISLAEMGFGSALIYKLYKPLSEKDVDRISELMTTAGKVFNRIARTLGIFILLCTFLLPYLIKDSIYSNTTLYLVFILAGIPYIIEYVWYKKYEIIINADQKKFKVNIINNLCTVVYDVFIIFALAKGIDIVTYILLNYPFIIIRGILFHYLYKKDYSYIYKSKTIDKEAENLSKDVFVHNIGSTINNSSDQIVLSIFNGLSFVSIYASYHYIVKYLSTITNAILYSVVHSFGNLFANDKEINKKGYAVFKEYLSFASFISIIVSVLFYFAVIPFIKIWIGLDNYILSTAGVLSFVMLSYTNIMFIPLSVGVSSTGLFNKTKYYSFIATIVNVVLSLAVIKKFQIAGIVFATVVSKLLVLTPLVIKAMYKEVFKEHKQFDYYSHIIKSLIITFIFITLINVFDLTKFYEVNVFNWILVSLVSGIIVLAFVTLFYYLTDKDFVRFLDRCKKLVLRRKNKK